MSRKSGLQELRKLAAVIRENRSHGLVALWVHAGDVAWIRRVLRAIASRKPKGGSRGA